MQIGGVLDSQEPLVEIGDGGVFSAGAVLRVTFGRRARGLHGAEGLPGGDEGGGIGIGPALELEGGGPRVQLGGPYAGLRGRETQHEGQEATEFHGEAGLTDVTGALQPKESQKRRLPKFW